MNTKTAIITIAGRPNVGKSTLTNHLVGEKIAIVSNKPQTTRNRICGIVTRDHTQFVFVDTPGFHKPKTKLGDFMVNAVKDSIADVDMTLLVVDPIASVGAQEEALIEQLAVRRVPTILVINKPCAWDEAAGVYTASADLNAADGYCYYMILTAADGTASEVAVNTPTDPVNAAYIDMASALQSYCSIVVEESAFDSSTLTLTAGKVQVQVPSITNEGETISCQEASVVLTHNGQELGKQALTLSETDAENQFEADLADITFSVPELENEEKLELMLTVTLTNGQTLSAYGGNWVCNTDELLLVVG